MSYKDAFNCAKCPRTSDENAPRACPMWWEISERNSQTEEFRVTKGCGYAMLPRLLIDMARETYAVRANIVAARNDVLGEMEKVNATAISTGRLLSAAISSTRSQQSRLIVSPPDSVAGVF